MITYAIFDWTGNRMTAFGEFEDFEDAWGYLYEKYPDDNDLQEFHVKPLF